MLHKYTHTHTQTYLTLLFYVFELVVYTDVCYILCNVLVFLVCICCFTCTFLLCLFSPCLCSFPSSVIVCPCPSEVLPVPHSTHVPSFSMFSLFLSCFLALFEFWFNDFAMLGLFLRWYFVLALVCPVGLWNKLFSSTCLAYIFFICVQNPSSGSVSSRNVIGLQDGNIHILFYLFWQTMSGSLLILMTSILPVATL